MKLIVVLLSLLIVAVGQNQFSNIPLDNPLTSFRAEAVNEIKISGKVIATIKNGDFVHPTFSPDGKILAYSNVVVRDKFENTEVLLYNLITRNTSVLLSSKQAEKYATYKAFVGGIIWKDQNRLEVEVSDGDVDSTRLIFNPNTRKLIREIPDPFDDAEVVPLSLSQEQARKRAIELFPEFQQDVLEDAIRNYALVIPDKGIVLQKHFAGHDSNIRFLDFQTKSIKLLMKYSEESAFTLSGGASFNSSFIFLVLKKPKAYLFLYQEGKIKGLAELDSPNFSEIQIKHSSPQRIVFLVRSHETYERGNNPLFVFDGEQLSQVKEYSELYDAEIDPSGRRIAYCYWDGDKRHITIAEMK